MRYVMLYTTVTIPLFIICTIAPEIVGIVQNHRQGLKFNQYLFLEQSIRNRGYPYVVGSDDTGRGAIAGPVMTASCCLLLKPVLTNSEIDNLLRKEAQDVFMLVRDSKLLTQAVRNTIYQNVISKPEVYAYAYAQRDAKDVDRLNIQKASMECFVESIESLIRNYNLPVNGTYCIVDGAKSPKLNVATPCRSYVKGDAHVLTISIASILAKVKRDHYMSTEAHELYPHYGFNINKGYATRDHIIAIHKYGPSPLHRMTFRSLKGR